MAVQGQATVEVSTAPDIHVGGSRGEKQATPCVKGEGNSKGKSETDWELSSMKEHVFLIPTPPFPAWKTSD